MRYKLTLVESQTLADDAEFEIEAPTIRDAARILLAAHAAARENDSNIVEVQDDHHYIEPRDIVDSRVFCRDANSVVVEPEEPFCYTREMKAKLALDMLCDARDLLRAAGAERTIAKLRVAISSARGAVRASRYRDMRLSPEEIEVRTPCVGEAEARAAGYQVVTFPDDPGKFYWKTASAVAFHGEDTVEAAWFAATYDMAV